MREASRVIKGNHGRKLKERVGFFRSFCRKRKKRGEWGVRTGAEPREGWA